MAQNKGSASAAPATGEHRHFTLEGRPRLSNSTRSPVCSLPRAQRVNQTNHQAAAAAAAYSGASSFHVRVTFSGALCRASRAGGAAAAAGVSPATRLSCSSRLPRSLVRLSFLFTSGTHTGSM